MLKRKAPLYLLLITVLLGSTLTFLITKMIYSQPSSKTDGEDSLSYAQSQYKVKRLAGYKFIKPLLTAKPLNENENYTHIKRSITDYIDGFKSQGVLNAASVYLRDFDQSGWIGVNDEEHYAPGSLLKVPELITYLRMEEEHPGILNKTLTFNQNFTSDKTAHIVTKGIELGKSYTIKQLLEYMIEYSDNNATFILNQNIDVPMFQKVFTDLGLTAPDWKSSTYPISAQGYSVFMEVLFNASYLNIKNSEYAVNLLTKSDFSSGIQSGIPVSNLLIAHKFGESGTNINRELHESALVYIKDKPYLLTIMTRGCNNVELSKLSQVIQGIASLVYNGLSDQGNS